MHKTLLDILADPISGTPFELEIHEVTEDGEIVEGSLKSEYRSYEITGGIPRFVILDEAEREQVQASFGYKWTKEDSFGTANWQSEYQKWILEKYGLGSIEDATQYFSGREYILDAGCGVGFPSSFWIQPGWNIKQANWVGLDISTAIDIARKRIGHVASTHFLQGDIFQLPFKKESFDTIFSEGVLHHTASTEKALKYLIPLLKPKGEILFYVYRKKGAIREFADDYIRQHVANMPPEVAWETLRPLTKLGQALAELKVELDVPEDIPFLGIKAGRIDIQRFLYWNVAKLYWNESMTFEEAHHVNFDWYHPHFAHRHTKDDIYRWCEEAGVKIHYFDEQESGYTVRAIKG